MIDSGKSRPARARDRSSDGRGDKGTVDPARRSAIKIVPVLDLKGGVVVHARRGQRADYAPLQSPLVEGSDPVDVARALTILCRTKNLYVADLDAIARRNPTDEATLTAIAAVAEIWVDAGATYVDRAAALARAGAARNVVGTESIRPSFLGNREFSAPQPPLVLSVDLRDGRLISPDPELADRDPVAAVRLAKNLGVRELLVIDLSRVGSGSGPPLDAVGQLVQALPGVAVYAGGGIRNDADLRELESVGATGALVATALHEGRITP